MASSKSLRGQILTAVGTCIAIALLLSALVTSFIASASLRYLLLAYVEHAVDDFAKHSILVMKTNDPIRAEVAIETLRSVVGIRTVQFFDTARRPLWTDRPPPPLPATSRAQWEDADAIHFLLPVQEILSEKDVDNTLTGSGERIRSLGLVYVLFDKSVFGSLTLRIYLTNFLITLLGAMALIAWVNQRIKKLTEPLSRLAETMIKAGAESGVRASVMGPNEAHEIATVFNTMMARQDNQRAVLEAEVKARTSELLETRDAALTASRIKTIFISTLSHEIRTPLTVIATSAQYALEELRFVENAPEVHQHLESILENTEGLLSTVEDILTYAKAESGKADLSVTLVSLQQIIQSIHEVVMPFVEKNRNRIDITLSGPAPIDMDRGKLYHIMLNLVTNACKFTQNGTVTLSIDHQPDALVFAVADSGIGIAPDQLALIFEPFHQVKRGDSQKIPGVGLGLAITKQFCAMLNGEIRVESEQHRGSTFRVRIPLPVKKALSES
jgi:two-component system, NarL family, sensor histidine kinase BarA